MNPRRPSIITTLCVMTLLPIVAACGRQASPKLPEEAGMMRYSEHLQMWERPDGVTIARVRNAWDTAAPPRIYALVNRGANLPSDLPEGAITIHTPLESSVVYSGVYTSLIAELGGIDGVSGMCDVEYVADTVIRARLADGRISDCGASTAPNVERVISLRPGAVMLSPLEGGNEKEKYNGTGLNVIEATDYLEPTPLGRAEWMRFIGRLYGRGEAADSIFGAVESEYNTIKEKRRNAGEKPSVLFDMIYSDSWGVPTAASVTGILISDAGGINPFTSLTKEGGAQLAPEKVVYMAKDADIWLIRHYEPARLTLSDMAKMNPIYTQFKAWKEGRVYGANTLESHIFEDGAFHPERVLRDMAAIFSGSEHGEGKYYRKIEN